MLRTASASLVLLLLTLAAPAAARPDLAVRIEGDRFSPLVTFHGPEFGHDSFLGTNRTWHIRSWVDRRTTLAEHQLYVAIDYVDGARGYWRAANDDAQDMAVTRLVFDKGTRGCKGLCDYSEAIGIDLPEALLEAKATTGFQIKLYARSGDTLILDIPRDEIAAQLQAIADYRNGPTVIAPAIVSPVAPDFGIEFKTTKPMWGLPGGALVGWIKNGSVAARSGLHWADTIIEWDGHIVSSAADLQAQLMTEKPGTKSPYKALRGRKIHELVAEF
ncbi:PDZ domain-containing protein [Sphingomonas sp. YR710]|uniref:S1C family serine protease n=1 Tax=Sphingomonas sp. YR710 TaxID=1882773 RepID=UPI000884D517|nr:S1C family serine protease [Sphingomonas sp. YR710]SDC49905.1 PDZ domain-containing protein [Sphingomonas sp. YR710]